MPVVTYPIPLWWPNQGTVLFRRQQYRGNLCTECKGSSGHHSGCCALAFCKRARSKKHARVLLVQQKSSKKSGVVFFARSKLFSGTLTGRCRNKRYVLPRKLGLIRAGR